MATIICPESVCGGAELTKEKRQELFGRMDGGAGSTGHERFARSAIEEGTGAPCPKTSMRINLRTNTLKEISKPNKNADGFDYSEDFDGVQTISDKTIYVNLKCVVGKGGVQTRSLREVYWLVEGQLQSLLKEPAPYFANILDGDEAAASLPKFEYLLSQPEFATVRAHVYCGDLRGYFGWLEQVLHE